MTLQPDRVREVMMILRHLIQVDPKIKWNNLPLADLMPPLETDLARAIIKFDDKAEPILSWFASSVFYMRGDTDDLPHIDIILDITPNAEN